MYEKKNNEMILNDVSYGNYGSDVSYDYGGLKGNSRLLKKDSASIYS